MKLSALNQDFSFDEAEVNHYAAPLSPTISFETHLRLATHRFDDSTSIWVNKLYVLAVLVRSRGALQIMTNLGVIILIRLIEKSQVFG